MAPDEPHHQEDDTPSSGQSHSDPEGPIAIKTTDPAIESVAKREAEWKTDVETTARVETAHVGEPSLLSESGVRRSVVQDHPHRGGGKDEGQDQNEDPGRRQKGRAGDWRDGNQQNGGSQGSERDRDRDQGERERDQDASRPRLKQPSVTKSLMLAAGVAVLGGVIGAAGYSYFFGSKTDKSDQSQSSSESGKGKESSSKNKSDGGSGKGQGRQASAEEGSMSCQWLGRGSGARAHVHGGVKEKTITNFSHLLGAARRRVEHVSA